ncbi:type IV secretion protein Rhs [Burkholderia sp. 4701]|nr:type IV secretion protein Rhs [Burkholderia sp. 4701]MXN85511.1 type IV secretion protein Rhs [Burkholderia sp. 4812]
MGLLAVKHLDPVVGVDVHSVWVAPSPTPVFLPHPHVGFMLDLREYVEAAKGVVGSIAMAIAQEKAAEYLDEHPDVAQKLDDAAGFAAGKLADLNDNPIVADALKLQKAAAALKGGIGDALGSGVGTGGSAGRPIFVNGLLRATAGTHSFHVPGLHFPLGEAFAPPPPENPLPSDDAESYMGSRTVLANNDPMSFMALPAMSCWSVGMEPPSHNGAHTERSYPSMPSSVMLPIPAGRPVLVGGPPVMNMAAAAKGLFKAFQGSKWAKALADKLHLKPGFLRCKVLKAEPVDATTGEVVVQHGDFTVSGRLPLEWERHYASHVCDDGAVGVGWQTPADIRLCMMPNDGNIGAVVHFPDHASAFDSLPAHDGYAARKYDWQRGYALFRNGDSLVLRTPDDLEYRFTFPVTQQEFLHALRREWQQTLPVERIADLNGNAWSFDRNADGSLARIAEWCGDSPAQRVIECEIGRGVRAGLLTSLTLIDSDGHAHPLVSYEHDDERNLISAIDAMANRHRFEYASGHQMVRHASARGVSFHYRYQQFDDGLSRVIRAWGENGHFDYSFAYDIVRMETRITNSLGHTTVLQMNERGMPVAEIDALGGVTGYRYDAHGRTSEEIDEEGRVTRLQYDAYGNLRAYIFPDGNALRSEYDDEHRLACLTMPGDRSWTFKWDERGNLIERTTPSRSISRYQYDGHGQLVSFTSPRGATTHFEYDREGRLAVLTNALDQRTRYTQDACGNVIEIIDASGKASRYEYDRNGNMIRAIEPGGHETHCAYDADGNLVKYRDSAGNVTRLEYSPMGQVTRRTAPDGSVVEYRYDTEEQLVEVIDERGGRHQMKRDANGRLVKEIDYWGQTRRYQYGPAGDLLRSTDPLGRTIDYVNDRLGRIVQKRIPDSRQPDGIRVEEFAYDACGNLLRAANPDRLVEFQHDAEGRVIEEKQGDDFSISFAYDADGNRIERRTRNALTGGIEHTVRYGYDALNAITSMQVDDSEPMTLERDADGNVSIEHLGAGLRRELSYAADGQLIRQALFAGTGEQFASEYAYDAGGRLIERRDSRHGTERFEYDPMGRITSHVDPLANLHRFVYDAAGDLLQTHHPPERSADEIRRSDGDSWTREGELDGCHYVFDRVGSLVRKQSVEQDLVLTWDADGLLTETLSTQRTMSGSRCIRTRYAYDAFQRRIRKDSDSWSDRAAPRPGDWQRDVRSRVVHFFWDGDALTREAIIDGRVRTDAGEGTDREWIYYPGTFRPVASIEYSFAAATAGSRDAPDLAAHSSANGDELARRSRRSGTTLATPLVRGAEQLHYFHNAPNGAPARVTDVTGKVVWEAGYSAWCRNAWQEQVFDQPLRLQGQYHDDETGLHYNRYRYYDPDIASFVSQDPIGLAGGENLYKFAPNIFDWIDPFGLRRKSARLKCVGRTPGKNSKTGRAVIAKMRSQGKIIGTGPNMMYKASNGLWHPISTADMTHKHDAVEYWNRRGGFFGAKSPEVRAWMLDPDNYELDHFSLNRSAGALLPMNYKDPLHFIGPSQAPNYP